MIEVETGFTLLQRRPADEQSKAHREMEKTDLVLE